MDSMVGKSARFLCEDVRIVGQSACIALSGEPMKRALVLTASWVAIALAGCSRTTGLLRPDPPSRQDVEALLAVAPLAPGENIRPTLLQHGYNMSLFLVQIADRETPHVHTRYDLSVLLVRGKGTLWLNGQPLRMAQGDAAFIPRGTPHFFVNEGSEPAAALVTFAPRFDGPDQVSPESGTQDSERRVDPGNSRQ
jgi:quercetin dioxygenase-like cupin family protein